MQNDPCQYLIPCRNLGAAETQTGSLAAQSSKMLAVLATRLTLRHPMSDLLPSSMSSESGDRSKAGEAKTLISANVSIEAKANAFLVHWLKLNPFSPIAHKIW
jgi:hypothetical protein